jgi:nucleotide-binding universal stress UspA family protein
MPMSAESSALQIRRNRILIAVDGSESSFNAVRYVVDLCGPDRCSVVLFHVLTTIPEEFLDINNDPALWRELDSVRSFVTHRQSVVSDFMEASIALLMERGLRRDLISVKVVEREMGIARAVLEEAENGYDAVVVGRHGTNELKELVMGTTADKLIGRLTHAPVWVIGERPGARRILLPFDGSEGSRKALDHAAAVLAGSQAEVQLLFVRRTVYDFVYDNRSASGSEEEPVSPLRETLERAAGNMREVLSEAAGRLSRTGLPSDCITTRIVEGESSRARAIVREARHGDYGTIVLGRRGMSRVEQFLMGRVSRKVLELAGEAAVWVVS